eukprot:355226-Chlamydomonas_euryale.AAC.1
MPGSSQTRPAAAPVSAAAARGMRRWRNKCERMSRCALASCGRGGTAVDPQNVEACFVKAPGLRAPAKMQTWSIVGLTRHQTRVTVHVPHAVDQQGR